MKIDRLTMLSGLVLAFAVGSATTITSAADAPADAALVNPATERQTAEILKRKVPEVKFDGALLEDVFEFLRDVTAVNFVPDWKRLQDAGLTRDKPINAVSKGIPLAELLTQLLANASDPKHPLKWANADGIILVSTPATLEAYEGAGKALAPDNLDEASRKLLDQRIHEVKFDGVPLGDAIDFIKDVTNAPLEMDWKALEVAGVDRKAKVTLRLRDVTFGQATRLILLGVTDKTPLRLSVKDGKAKVTAGAPAK